MAHRSVAISYSNLGMRSAQSEALRKAFELSDRVSERERLLIHAEYYNLNEMTWDKTLESYLKLLELYPDDWIGRTNLGLFYLEIEEWERAEKLFRENIPGNPEIFIPCWNLVETYEAMGRYDKAHEIIESYLKINPDSADFHRKQALVYMYEGKYDLAFHKLDEALSLKPDLLIEITKLRGQIHLLEGEFEKVEDEFKKLPRDQSRIFMAILSIS